jgi:hypothetical protein
MVPPRRILSRRGSVVVIPTIIDSAGTKTTSTPSASPSTERQWIRADLVKTQDTPPSAPERAEPKNYPWAALFPSWHDKARCKDVDKPDDMFFGEDENHNRTSLTITKIREVKAFCMGCPVFTDCLTHALTQPERHGIWAGTSKRTRMRILDLVARGKTTVETVVEDYLSGRERQYESIRSR